MYKLIRAKELSRVLKMIAVTVDEDYSDSDGDVDGGRISSVTPPMSKPKSYGFKDSQENEPYG